MTTGKTISGRVELSLSGMDRVPKEFQDALKVIGGMTGHIRTHDLQSFPGRSRGNAFM